MPNPNSSDFGAAYRPNEILIQFDPNSNAADHSRALEVIGGRLNALINGDGGGLARVGLGHGMTVEKAIELLSHLPGVKFAEPDYLLTSTAVSNDPSVTNGTAWSLLGDAGPVTNAFGTQAVDAWAAGNVGSTKVAVGMVDTGIDYTHPDLYLNIWLNQGEIPLALRSALTDTDGDGRITFRDLNQAANASFVTDVNANGRIDAGDLLNDARWENAVDEDGNGYKDDLIGWDFQNNDNDPMDDAGHGTHTAGTVGAMGGNGVGAAGVAWNVQLVALKFSGAAGGYLSDAVTAQDYFANASKADTKANYVATNNSYGMTDSYSQAFQDAIVRLAKADILYVAAAGNGSADYIGDDNDTTPFYPASYSTLAGAGFEGVISVAAIDKAGALTSFSNYGAKSVDLAAPGSYVYSTLKGGGYGYMNGTSMAAPQVAGAIALYAAAHPTATAAEIQAALMQSTAPTASLAGKTVTGGRLDIEHFVNTVVTIATPAPTPTPTPTPTPVPTTGVVLLGTAANEMFSPSAVTATTGYADTVTAAAGSDTLDGGAGADSLVGGTGNDLYVVDNAGDVVVELANEGDDLVQAGVSWTLGANVERLTLTGSGATSGTGNALANVITGNGGDNVLSGLAGNDQLNGGAGNDKLLGGDGADTLNGGSGNDTLAGGAGVDWLTGDAGKDRFVFDRGTAQDDRVMDFAKGDILELHGYSAGSTIAKVAGTNTDWVIHDKAAGTDEVIHLMNGYALKVGDYLFT